MNEAEARKRVRELRKYYGHLTSYVGTIGFLFALNLMTSPGEWWFVFPALGWGIGILQHTVRTFGFFGVGSRQWEEQKVRELTEGSATRDEIRDLRERIDDLVVTVSSRKWDDPRLDQAASSLEQEANELLRRAESADRVPPPPPLPGARPESGPESERERLTRLLRDLESIVTSPEFDLLERREASPREDRRQH